MSLPMLTRIKAQNLLSFGPEGIDLELPALTVLIGPNGSGKSNLLETVGLLHGAPSDFASPIRVSGGIQNWIWRGWGDCVVTASVEAEFKSFLFEDSLSHTINFRPHSQVSSVVNERIGGRITNIQGITHEFEWNRDELTADRRTLAGGAEHTTEKRPIGSDKSILSEVKDQVSFPELDLMSNFYDGISLYRQWEFGPKAAIRQPQRIDVKPNPLLEDFSNLGMFLNRFRQHPQPKTELFDRLGDLYSGLRDFELNIEGGTVQIFFTEGDFSIPATRLSDGSLRYLCLLAILLDPEPPRLVCIEEPELGFHPDLIPKLADLLVDASSRCQVIVTTHSDILVDALSDRPESVVVCEKHDGQTSMRRLDQSDLEVWLKKYRLGELWTRGELGGVRW